MKKLRDRNATHGDRKSRLLGAIAGNFLKLWGATLRIETEDRSGLGGFTRQPRTPVIFLLWHSRILSLPPVWWEIWGRFRDPVILTSASKDGAIVEAAMKTFGMPAVRGSSSRRGAAAIVALRAEIRAGKDVCITPDGPRGPRHVFQPGAVKLAQATGAPIVPIHLICPRAWRFNTWDKLVLPKPFSRVKMIAGPAHYVPRDLTGEEFSARSETIRAAMLAITDDA